MNHNDLHYRSAAPQMMESKMKDPKGQVRSPIVPLDLVGDKRFLLVIRDMPCGKTTANWRTHRKSTNILADRLSAWRTQGSS
jgi:hypothetical protein